VEKEGMSAKGQGKGKGVGGGGGGGGIRKNEYRSHLPAGTSHERGIPGSKVEKE